MGRGTVYNNITSPELVKQISQENKDLMNDFLEYLQSIDRAATTIKVYRNNLEIFFVWNLQNNNNKSFVDLSKREIAKFQNYALNTLGWGSARMKNVKSALSSLSTYIEDILDDEYEDFRPIINKIKNPVSEPKREKTVLKDEEVDELLHTLVENKKYQMACAVALAAMSGARKSELLRFKVSYFDDENIMEGTGLYKTPEKIKTKGRGKGKMLNKYTLKDFKYYLDLWLEERKKKGIESEWIFVGKDGEQMKKSNLDSYANTISNMIGKPFYFHCMRHYLCTKLSKLNIPDAVIVEYYGWGGANGGGLEMKSLYDDTEASDDFGKYFTSEGIKAGEQKGLGDL